MTPAYLAEIAIAVFPDDDAVVIGNDAARAPVATVTEAGQAATPGRLLVKVTTAPPAGAGPLSFTVPVAFDPALTDVGLIVRETSATGTGGFTARVAVRVAPA